MPAKMFMSITNQNHGSIRFVPNNTKSVNTLSKPGTSSLKGPIIGRVHNVKPGCGGCGK